MVLSSYSKNDNKGEVSMLIGRKQELKILATSLMIFSLDKEYIKMAYLLKSS